MLRSPRRLDYVNNYVEFVFLLMRGPHVRLVYLLNILTQTPNATRNEAEFDISRFSRKTKMTIIGQKQPVNILNPLVFVCR